MSVFSNSHWNGLEASLGPSESQAYSVSLLEIQPQSSFTLKGLAPSSLTIAPEPWMACLCVSSCVCDGSLSERTSMKFSSSKTALCASRLHMHPCCLSESPSQPVACGVDYFNTSHSSPRLARGELQRGSRIKPGEPIVGVNRLLCALCV